MKMEKKNPLILGFSKNGTLFKEEWLNEHCVILSIYVSGLSCLEADEIEKEHFLEFMIDHSCYPV